MHFSNIMDVVPVGTADENDQRDTSGIYNDVALGAEFASIRGVRARFLVPPGAWYRGAIDAGPAPINLVMFTQTSPASHATAVAQGLGKVLPWNAMCAAQSGCH